MNRPVPLSSTNNRAASTMLPANAPSYNAHKANSSMTTTILDRIAAERHKIQEEDSKRHEIFRREATSISCKHHSSSCYDVSPPAYGVLHVPTFTKTYDRSSPSNTTTGTTMPPPPYDDATTAHKSITTGSIKLIQISSTASQQRRNSASNANERHFLVENDERNDESSPSTSTSTSPNMAPPKRRPHPNSLLSTAWGMASSRSVHDEMERIRLLMADMDSQSSRPSQQRKPRRGSAFVSSSTTSAPPVSPTKLASRKTH